MSTPTPAPITFVRWAYRILDREFANDIVIETEECR